MRFDIVTIFPHILDSYFNESILKRAQKNKLLNIKIHSLIDFKNGKRKILDGTPYGGGAGMVLKALPILKSTEKILNKTKNFPLPLRRKDFKAPAAGPKRARKTKIIILSAKGRQFNQRQAENLAKNYSHIIMISGRYEGIDERVRKILRAEEVSIGPYVLSDGDVAAAVIVSAVTRLIPGVIKLKSLKEESHFNLLNKKGADSKKKGFEYPHYTKPEILVWKEKKYRVPKVLLSGNHKNIREWRDKHSK